MMHPQLISSSRHPHFDTTKYNMTLRTEQEWQINPNQVLCLQSANISRPPEWTVAVSLCRFDCWFPCTGDSHLRIVLVLKIPIPDGRWCRPGRVLVLGLFLVALQKWLGWCPNAPLWQWLLGCGLPETSRSSAILGLELHSAVAW